MLLQLLLLLDLRFAATLFQGLTTLAFTERQLELVGDLSFSLTRFDLLIAMLLKHEWKTLF